MKAIVYRRYGSPDELHPEEVPKPAIIEDDDVVVKVHAVSVNAYDWRLLRGSPFPARLYAGLIRPRYPILGADIAGRVEAVGPKVTQVHPGMAVVGDNSPCRAGGFAQYVRSRENLLVPIPEGVSFERAAAVPMAAVTALQALRDFGRVQKGQEVAINGASGGAGSFAVQIAKYLGATVTALCSARKIDLVRLPWRGPCD